MAFIAHQSALIDELVVSNSSNIRKLDHSRSVVLREIILRSLTSHNHPPTNQFEVDAELKGLEEKFQVYNKDPIADALRGRLEKLSKLSFKWTPECLHLLLKLSDRPVSNLSSDVLHQLVPPKEETEAILRWEDLALDDPALQDVNIWSTIDYTADSSDEENLSTSSADNTDTSPNLEDDILSENAHSVKPGLAIISLKDFEKLKLRQWWRNQEPLDDTRNSPVHITAIQATREIFFILQGCSTSLFKIDNSQMLISTSPNFVVNGLSPHASRTLLSDFAETGTTLARLRTWTRRQLLVPLLQVLQSEILQRLNNFHVMVTKLEADISLILSNGVSSLVRVKSEVHPMATLLSKMCGIIESLDSDPKRYPFRYLELLYKEICTSQMLGDGACYEFMGRIFFSCFQVYLRPIKTWMTEGELNVDDKIFFVSRSSSKTERATIWKDHYQLRRTPQAALYAPSFLEPAAQKIFTTGKSVVVLKQLGSFNNAESMVRDVEEALTFDSVCGTEEIPLSPFTEMFNTAFDRWIESKHLITSSTLSKCLFETCGLDTVFTSLENIYFMRDGSVSSLFADSIFKKLDRGNASWNDRFTTTEIAQATIGSIPGVTADRLRCRILSGNRNIYEQRKPIKSLECIKLDYFLPWPVQLVISGHAIDVYQSAFTFLFQIRRAHNVIVSLRSFSSVTSETDLDDERALFYKAQTRLLWFINSLYDHLTSYVLTVLTSKFRQKFASTLDVDAMIAAHTYLAARVEKQMMLHEKLDLIRESVIAMLDLAIRLADLQGHRTRATKGGQLSTANRKRKKEMIAYDHKPSTPSKRIASRRLTDSSDSDTEIEEARQLDSGSVTTASKKDYGKSQLPYIEQLQSITSKYESSLRFITMGLRAVARVGSDDRESWEALAERLEVGNNVSF